MEQFSKRKCGVTKPQTILPHLPLHFSRCPQPHPALPETRENLLRMQPPPCSHSLGSRSPWTAFEKGFVSAQWVENEGLGMGKVERKLGQGQDGGWMDDGGEAALDHCLPSTISWPAGEAGMEGKKHPIPSQGTKKKSFRRDFSSPSRLPRGVSKKITMSHSSHTHTQQLIFLGRNGETRTAAISIVKGKTPAKHTYLFTVQEKQMDKERKEEKGERGKKGI